MELSLSRDSIFRSRRARLTGVPDCDPSPWYRFGTGCTVPSVQIVHGPGHIGNDGRSETHRHLNPLGWGPKVRWFKSSRPDYKLTLNLGLEGLPARRPRTARDPSRLVQSAPPSSSCAAPLAFAREEPLTAVGARLRAWLAAGERQAQDRPLDHGPLPAKRPAVVGQPVALADRPSPAARSRRSACSACPGRGGARPGSRGCRWRRGTAGCPRCSPRRRAGARTSHRGSRPRPPPG